MLTLFLQVSYSQDGKNLMKFHSSSYRFNSWVYGIGVVTSHHKISPPESSQSLASIVDIC